MEKITWTTERRSVVDLIPADYNPRMMTEKDRYDLKESVKKFNDVEPVVLNIGSRNNILIGGHQRIQIYADLGMKEIDVRVPNRELSIEEETELNIRLNKNTGNWDWDKLKFFDKELLENFGFSNEEIMVNFGLNNAEDIFVDEERFEVLEILPPESPRLKEKVVIHFDNIDEYKKVKKAISDGKITKDSLMQIL